MQLWFVFSLVFSIIIAAFAVLNSDTVTIRFFWESVQLSQSLVILLSAAIGAAIALFLGLFRTIKSTLKIRELSGKYNNAEKEIQRLNDVVKNYELKENSYMPSTKVELAIDEKKSEIKEESIQEDTVPEKNPAE